MARLVIEAPERLQAGYDLQGSVSIGRQAGNAIKLDDREVSKRHCLIEQAGSEFFLTDLGSLNGTLVNGRRAEGRILLRDGDVITMSDVQARFLHSPAAAPAPAVLPPSKPPPPAPVPSLPPKPSSPAAPSASPEAPTPVARPAVVPRQAGSPPPPPPPVFAAPPASPAFPAGAPVPAASSPPVSGGPAAMAFPPALDPPGRPTPPPSGGAIPPPPPRPGNQTRFITIDASPVQGKVALETRRFLPERDLLDTAALRRDYERLRIAYEMINRIGQELDLDTLLHRILEMCFDMLPADRGVIMIYEENGALVPRALLLRKPDSTEVMDISTSMVKMVERERVGILCSDATNDPRFQAAMSVIRQSIRSSMAVPLVWRERLLGILVLDCQHAINVFRDKDLQVLTAIAGQAAMFVANSHLVREKQEEAVARARLQRLFSPDIADMVVSGKAEVKPGGEPRKATILFSDLRGFTSMSEAMTAGAIVQMLNRFFERMVDVIFRFGGTLDKFVGDEIMALFGAPFARPDDPVRAVRCALAMLESLQGFNEERGAAGVAPLRMGIGINTGDVVAGYIGSPKALQYTVIGSPVNLANRLCSRARDGNWIVLSETTWELVRDRFESQELDPVPLKGITRPIRTFAVTREK
ncbi:MAG: FHA domain-containing protein [Candidatus Riflebacteria bacterium]|nr:FHA domain-containing protein [Candidatus Riflebacteria bacterium]